MRKYIAMLLVVCMAALLVGCSKTLVTSGCRVIRDDGEYVTYQIECENCGYEFGTPTTAYVSNDQLFFNVSCTLCGEIIYVQLERK